MEETVNKLLQASAEIIDPLEAQQIEEYKAAFPAAIPSQVKSTSTSPTPFVQSVVNARSPPYEKVGPPTETNSKNKNSLTPKSNTAQEKYAQLVTAMKRSQEFRVGISASRSCPSIKARKIERNTILDASEGKTMIEAKYIKIHPNARDRVNR